MWSTAVLVILISVLSVYSTRNLQALDVVQSNVARSVADEMAVYRSAVINYFSQNDLRGTSVSMAALKLSGALPGWSNLSQQAAPPIWNNYRDAAGIIYIYAATLPSVNISAELAHLSKNSVLAGVYRSGSATLQSPVFGDTNIPLAALNGISIPDGAPVWIAMTK